jgi:hypothetical protein
VPRLIVLLTVLGLPSCMFVEAGVAPAVPIKAPADTSAGNGRAWAGAGFHTEDAERHQSASLGLAAIAGPTLHSNVADPVWVGAAAIISGDSQLRPDLRWLRGYGSVTLGGLGCVGDVSCPAYRDVGEHDAHIASLIALSGGVALTKLRYRAEADGTSSMHVAARLGLALTRMNDPELGAAYFVGLELTLRVGVTTPIDTSKNGGDPAR